jgi:hypothetical protein
MFRDLVPPRCSRGNGSWFVVARWFSSLSQQDDGIKFHAGPDHHTTHFEEVVGEDFVQVRGCLLTLASVWERSERSIVWQRGPPLSRCSLFWDEHIT